MEFEQVVDIVFSEVERLQNIERMEKIADSIFESVKHDSLPVAFQKIIERQLFFSEGPEVTTPADEFVFYY